MLKQERDLSGCGQASELRAGGDARGAYLRGVLQNFVTNVAEAKKEKMNAAAHIRD